VISLQIFDLKLLQILYFWAKSIFAQKWFCFNRESCRRKFLFYPKWKYLQFCRNARQYSTEGETSNKYYKKKKCAL